MRFFYTVVAFLAASALVPSTASGQAAEKVISILALDQDAPEKILVRSDDLNAGVSLQILEIPSMKVKKGWFVESKRDERNRSKRLMRKRFPIEARVNQQEPRERYTVIGAPDRLKKNYQIMVMREGRVGVIGLIPLKEGDGDDKRAVGMLKEVVWAPNGKMILCVLNQKMDLPDGKYDVDAVHFLKFRAWKIKWVKAEASGDSKAEP
ncbi:MAG: hypothetical protein ACI9WU_000021 [Myxococcota bacterium]